MMLHTAYLLVLLLLAPAAPPAPRPAGRSLHCRMHQAWWPGSPSQRCRPSLHPLMHPQGPWKGDHGRPHHGACSAGSAVAGSDRV